MKKAILVTLAILAAQMPLAVYTWYVASPQDLFAERASAYYPFCDYSPELVALRFGAADAAFVGALAGTLVALRIAIGVGA